MARQKAKQRFHAVKGRKNKYQIKLDGGLYDRLRKMARQDKPHYKKFIAAWDELKRLNGTGKLSEVDKQRRNEMLVSFLKIAEALLKKYDGHLQDTERQNKRERYVQRMNAVFRIVVSDKLQTGFNKQDAMGIIDVHHSMDAIRAIGVRHHLPIHLIP